MFNYDAAENSIESMKSDKIGTIRNVAITDNSDYFYTVSFNNKTFRVYGNFLSGKFAATARMDIERVTPMTALALGAVGSYQDYFIMSNAPWQSFLWNILPATRPEKQLFPDAKEDDNPYLLFFKYNPNFF
jgi:hypothetical protein